MPKGTLKYVLYALAALVAGYFLYRLGVGLVHLVGIVAAGIGAAVLGGGGRERSDPNAPRRGSTYQPTRPKGGDDSLPIEGGGDGADSARKPPTPNRPRRRRR